jgi:hypothetical protein
MTGEVSGFYEIWSTVVAETTRRFSTQARGHAPRPSEVTTDRAAADLRVLDELLPPARHVPERTCLAFNGRSSPAPVRARHLARGCVGGAEQPVQGVEGVTGSVLDYRAVLGGALVVEAGLGADGVGEPAGAK